MPVYTYRCENCGIQFDQQQSFRDNPLETCPECDENSLHKVYRPVGIVFKGSGFYATDNRSPSGQKSRAHDENVAKEEKGSGSTEKKTGESKGVESPKKETKAEKKSE